ncbi:MAG: Sec-independent protein translocase protein TatB [Acidimicrobiia bacterium]|nr:Sec-independent protein translocase protein TatB [Acidimicrobiia bacterium]
MGNLGGGEILVILVVALLVLGPTRLPTAARQVGNALGELRRLSSGFQNEMKSAMDEVAVESSDTTTADSTADGTIAPDADAEAERRARSRRLVTGSDDATEAPPADDEDLGVRNGFEAEPAQAPDAAGDDAPS